MNRVVNKSNKAPTFTYIFIAALLFVFCVMKVIRGQSSEVTSAGGFWNYISLFYFPLCIFSIANKNQFQVKPVGICIVLYMIFSLVGVFAFTQLSISQTTIYNILMVPYPFIVFTVFYNFTTKSVVADRIIIFAYVICLIINFYTIVSFLFGQRSRPMASDIYFSLCMFPFIMVLVKNRLFRFLLTFMQFATVFISNKRTALIAFVIAYLLFVLISMGMNTKRNVFRLLETLFICVVIFTMLFFISKYVDNTYELGIFDRLMRLEEDQGSGRVELYQSVWTAFKNSRVINQLFGHGLHATGEVCTTDLAHNDFLEVLYDYGIFAFLAFVGFYIAIIVNCVKMVKARSPYAGALAMSLVIGLMLSMFSYFLAYYTYVTCAVAFWGFIFKKEKDRLYEISLGEAK